MTLDTSIYFPCLLNQQSMTCVHNYIVYSNCSSHNPLQKKHGEDGAS